MSEVLCKWVSKDMKTMNDTKWKVGVPNKLPEKDDLELCEEGLFHYFPHPLLAVMFKKFYYCGGYTKLYQVKPEGKIVEDWSKCGSTKLTLVKKLEIPEVTLIQKVAFGILCALEVSDLSDLADFVSWGEKWLSGEDRSVESANVALLEAHSACFDYSTFFANIPANASYAAYWAVNAAYCASSCNGKELRIGSPAYYASYASNLMKKPIDFISIAKKAMEVK